MIYIKIYFLSILADITGKKEINLAVKENSTIKQILEKLILKFGKEFEKTILNSPNDLNKYIILGLNGKQIRSLDYLYKVIQEGDEISFLPAIAGG